MISMLASTPHDPWGDNFKLNTNVDMTPGGYLWLPDVIKGYLVILCLVTAWFYIKAMFCAARSEWNDAWINFKLASLIFFIGFMGPALIVIAMAWFAGSKKSEE
jgi:hypothetical protein